MITVEVFKTNVGEEVIAARLIRLLQLHYPNSKINFDLEDCDKILRVAEKDLAPEIIIATLNEQGYQCELL